MEQPLDGWPYPGQRSFAVTPEAGTEFQVRTSVIPVRSATEGVERIYVSLAVWAGGIWLEVFRATVQHLTKKKYDVILANPIGVTGCAFDW